MLCIFRDIFSKKVDAFGLMLKKGSIDILSVELFFCFI